ncbi:MAG: formate dehydrogenase [Candidatus Marinimicrobia bacterium]|nr:formate dehydrogenase [Candidatus Neomarinimicrobiota bacterium]|tara:strand:+ start:4961 stop:7810 length:2850 start_codon:yes stop_codon:yes gene_type:complete
MSKSLKKSIIEKACESLGLLRTIEPAAGDLPRGKGDFSNYPPPDKWHDWTEYDAGAWPRREKKNYSIVPTTCFNCEAACGLLAYIDKENGKVRKFEGNPHHPASRGRNCAKGPATINQINDAERILYPMKRAGKRGSGQWEQVSWDEAVSDIAGKMHHSLKAKRHNSIVYHVGRPGHEGYAERVIQSWGVDGHNSHTNICSAGARTGYALWHFFDRPSPDHANAKTILLISSHLETGHYFNPHAQRIIEGMMSGAKLIVMDPRLSNTASMADIWLPTYPGSEAAVLLAMAKIILDEGLYDRSFMETWVNWHDYLAAVHPGDEVTFDNFIDRIKGEYAKFTPEFAGVEAGLSAENIVRAARHVAEAGSQLSTHNWRAAGSGNLGGWQVSRCLHFLNVLTGSVGTEGGTSPSAWNKFKPTFFNTPPAQKFWNELQYPIEYPLAHHELSFLLPHFLKDGRGELDVYFTRVFNPIWTYPDGFSWIEVLRDESKIKCHVALTPTWNETAFWADYVLPMGHASERHDLNSYETHSSVWIAFRQPVLREFARREGREVELTHEVNPGEVWEEDEFWIELSWQMDSDESLGIRDHFKSPYRTGQKITVDEYYQFIFENVPGLPEAASSEGLSPLDYMRKVGAFEVEASAYAKHMKEVSIEGAELNGYGQYLKDGKVIAIHENGSAVAGFPTPSRKQEFYSKTMDEWKWGDQTLPGYIKSHIHPDSLDKSKNEYVLVPTFRLPMLIHSRSGNAKWLAEIAHRNPVWIHPTTASHIGLKHSSDLVKVETDIGYFIDKVWITEAIKPDVVACSHHIGRWRRPQDPAANSWMTSTVRMEEMGDGRWEMGLMDGVEPFQSQDSDSKRIWWRDGGVHQNITFPVHPDPVSGMHCWHQKVRLTIPSKSERYGDIEVDTKKAHAVYKEWIKMTRPGPGPGSLRRPLWMARTLRPADEAYYVADVG